MIGIHNNVIMFNLITPMGKSNDIDRPWMTFSGVPKPSSWRCSRRPEAAQKGPAIYFTDTMSSKRFHFVYISPRHTG